MEPSRAHGMKILGAAGDPGGSRSLIPVFDFLFHCGVPIQIFEHGFLHKEAPSLWPRVSLDFSQDLSSLERILNKGNIRAFVFGSSLKDIVPLQIARLARSKSIPVIHVLDHWANYIQRLQVDGLPPLFPDIYAVMDQNAYVGASEAGIPPSILRITGQPAFSALLDDPIRLSEGAGGVKKEVRNLHVHKKKIFFVSEPIASDQGSSPSSPDYRGYTENTVLTLLCHCLQSYASAVRLFALPHPRENPEDLTSVLKKEGGALEWGILIPPAGRQGIYSADGVIGMASVLLYEAWLIGKPVISLQPGLRIKDLAFMNNREGCYFLDNGDNLTHTLGKFLVDIERQPREGQPRGDIRLHSHAAEIISNLIMSL